MTNRQIVLDAFNCKPVPRVPVGFWTPYMTFEDAMIQGTEHPELIRDNLDKHKEFIKAFKPDMLKFMSDGFFLYPNFEKLDVQNPQSILNMKPLGKDHPWIIQQVEAAKELLAALDVSGGGALFYNVFSPFTYLKMAANTQSINEDMLVGLMRSAPEVMHHALGVVTEDSIALIDGVLKDAGCDGIYLPVQNLKTPELTRELYGAFIEPLERRLIEHVNSIRDNVILHICGGDRKNDFSVYRTYEAKVFNWSVKEDGMSLSDGKKMFNGKAVLGGFDKTMDGVLFSGSKEEIEKFTEELLKSTGKTGIIIGADCVIHPAIPVEKLNWVRDKAAT